MNQNDISNYSYCIPTLNELLIYIKNNIKHLLFLDLLISYSLNQKTISKYVIKQPISNIIQETILVKKLIAIPLIHA
jgi:hypothetical protein